MSQQDGGGGKALDGGGGKAEEAVRSFFLRSGYFAARGIKFRIENEEVTDLDLWAYGVGSPTHRERVVVDCKYKSKPQAFERVIWVEGMRRATWTEHAVVATTDGRESVRVLAARMQIRLIGPEMLTHLIAQNADSQRLSDEELSSIVLHKDDKLFGRIKERLESSKSLLLRLDFDSVNSHFADLRYYAEESTRVQQPSALIRLFYLSASFLLISLDFALREAAFVDSGRVRSRIEEGVRYGSRGRTGANALLSSLGSKKKTEVMRAAETVRADIPAEFFGRYAGTNWFHQTALVLEDAAYRKQFIPVGKLPPEAQSVIGVALDFLGIERNIVFSVAM
jgi:hypothetical protein